MLLRFCLTHITIIILRHILYLVCLGPYLLCDLFFIFSLIFISVDHITSLKQTHLFFAYFLEYLVLFLDDNVDEENE